MGGRVPKTIALIIIVLFVGFRFETGFDWPFYKDLHYDLGTNYVLNDITYFYDLFGVEVGFLLLAGHVAQLMNYELFQFFSTLLFMYSTLKLARSVGHKNATLVLALSLTFLLLTLAFSTLRQCLAISLFNLGIAYYYQDMNLSRKSHLKVTFFFALAISMQTSAAIYCACFMYSNIKVSSTIKNFILVSTAFLTLYLTLYPETVQGLLGSRIDAKVKFYSEANSSILNPINALYLALILFSFIGITYAMPRDSQLDVSPIARLTKFATVLLVLNFVFIPSSIVRDRISYELFIVMSILLSHHRAQLRQLFQAGLVTIGIVFSYFTILSQYTVLAFEPYQNYLIAVMFDIPSDARQRQEVFFRQYEERLRAAR
jgi:hypothetical protein